MPIKVGDALPAVEVQEGEPGNKVSMDQLFKGKKGILFGVPGAFTPGCSKTHLPGYVEKADGKVLMLADTKAAFAKAAGLDLDLSDVLGSVRCKRFAMTVDDGAVVDVMVEPDGTGMTCSLATSILEKL